MPDNQQTGTAEWRKFVSDYNCIVCGFREIWGLMRVLALVHPSGGSNINVAKQRIKELQNKIGGVEVPLRSGRLAGAGVLLQSLDLELKIFRELLERIDGTLTPMDIRVFCERKHDSRDAEMVDLLKFYISRNLLSDDDLDKIDLLATELCCTRLGQTRVLKNVFEVDKLFELIFPADVSQSDFEETIVNEFKGAVQNIQALEGIDEIMGSDVIATMRSFKKEIREHIVNPRILKSIAVYNISLNNRLIDIFDKESTDIISTSEVVEKIKGDLRRTPLDKQESIKAILEKIEEIQRSFQTKQDQSRYDLNLIVEAARYRKAISDAMNQIKVIRDPQTEESSQPLFTRKTTQMLINEVSRELYRLEEKNENGRFMPELDLDLLKLDAWERSVFLVDIDALKEDRRLFEVVQEAIILSHKILADYKYGKESLSRREMTSLVAENMELSQNLNSEIQTMLDKFDPRMTKRFKVIDLMKVKSSLVRSIKRLISYSRMEGFVS